MTPGPRQEEASHFPETDKACKSNDPVAAFDYAAATLNCGKEVSRFLDTELPKNSSPEALDGNFVKDSASIHLQEQKQMEKQDTAARISAKTNMAPDLLINNRGALDGSGQGHHC